MEEFSNFIKTEMSNDLEAGKVKEIITRLTTEDWISGENQKFIEIFNGYIEKLNIISEFYEQIAKDLLKIKIEMEIEMNKKPSIHFE